MEQGENQARRLGVKFDSNEVIAIEKGEYFDIYTADQNYSCKAVLLATGQQIVKLKNRQTCGNLKEMVLATVPLVTAFLQRSQGWRSRV